MTRCDPSRVAARRRDAGLTRPSHRVETLTGMGRRPYLVLPWLATVFGCGDPGHPPSASVPALTDAAVPDFAHLQTCVCSDCEQRMTPSSALHTVAPHVPDGGAPVGGEHHPCWGRWGVHAKPLAPERLIHNLEHGGIAFLYHCPEGCPDELAWLEAFVEQQPLTLLSEYASMTGRFAAVAWGARFQSSCFDPHSMAQFYERHVDRGPERFALPPPGPPSSCD